MLKTLNIEIDGKSVKVKARKSAGNLWLHFNGQTHFVELKTSSKRSGKAQHVESHQIASIMPGKIIKINKKTGDKISHGDVVVIMEAMKMEYSLSAQKSGKIKSINCKEGQQIKPNMVLVEIE